MPSSNGRINLQVGFNVDKSGLAQVTKSLQNLQSIKPANFNGTKEQLQQVKRTAAQVQQALNKAFNVNLNSINVDKFKKELNGLNVDKIYQDFAKIGPQGKVAFNQVASSVLTTNLQLRETKSLLNDMGTTMLNTVKWGIASSVMNTFTGSVQQAFSYVKGLDSALTDIRIVTQDSAAQMQNFAARANKAAQALGRSTMDYTKAALTFYQQGLNDQDVQARTQAVLKAQNITGAGSQMADYLTAVWNGYKVANEQAELYVDKLAAVADSSASDMSQLAIAMSKVASTANAMGVDVDQLNAQIATIVATTRQAPESVGNALKTIYARINDISTGAEDAQVSLGNYSKQMAAVGFSVLDTNGNLRDTGEVIEQIGGKWAELSREEQIYLARTMAGQRQYNNLIALFDNWSNYSDLLNVSLDSQGTLVEKNSIYMESLAAKMEQLGAAGERVKSSLIDSDSFKVLIEGATGLVDLLANVIESIGGGGNALLMLGSIATQVFSGVIAKEINSVVSNFQAIKENARILQTETLKIKLFGQSEGYSQEVIKGLVDAKAAAVDYYSVMDTHQIQEYDALVKQVAATEQKKIALQGQYEQIKKVNEAFEQTAQKMDNIDSDTLIDDTHEKLKDLKNTLDSFKGKQLLQLGEYDSFSDLQNQINNLKENLGSLADNVSGFEKFDQAIQNIGDKSNITAQELRKVKNAADAIAEQTGGILKFSGDVEESGRAAQGAAYNFEQAKQSADGYLNSVKQFSNIKSIVQMTSKVGQLAGALLSLKNLGNIWSNQNLSGGEKLLQTITNLGMTVPTLISSFKSIVSVLATRAIAEKKLQTQMQLNTLEQQKSILQQERATLVQKQNSIQIEKNAAVQEKQILVSEKERKERDANTHSIEANTLAIEANNAAKEGDYGKAISLRGESAVNEKRSQELAEQAKALEGPIQQSQLYIDNLNKTLEQGNAAIKAKSNQIENLARQISTLSPQLGVAYNGFQKVKMAVSGLYSILGPVGIAIGVIATAIGVGYKIWDKYTISVKQAQEAIQNFNTKQKQTGQVLKKLDGGAEQLSKIKHEYQALAEKAGADQLDKNIENLTDKERVRYNQLKNLIAEYNQAAVAGYNEQGQAILNNNKALQETLDLLQKQKIEQYKDTYTGKDFKETQKSKTTIYKNEQENLADLQFQAYEDIAKADLSTAGLQSVEELIQKLSNYTPQIQQKIDTLKDAWNQGVYTEQTYMAQMYEMYAELTNQTDKVAPKLIASIESQKRVVQQASKFNPMDFIGNWIGNEDQTYLNLVEQYGSSIVNALVAGYNEGLDRSTQSFQSAQNKIKANVLQPLKNSNISSEVLQSMSKSFEEESKELETLTGKQYEETLQNIVNSILQSNESFKNLDVGTQQALLKALFGVDVQIDDNGIVQDIADNYTKVRDKAIEEVQKRSTEISPDQAVNLGKIIEESDTKALEIFIQFLEQGNLHASNLNKQFSEYRAKIEQAAAAAQDLSTLDLLGRKGSLNEEQTAALQQQLQELGEKYPQLQNDIDILNQSWLEGTLAYQESLRQVNNQLLENIQASKQSGAISTEEASKNVSQFITNVQALQNALGKQLLTNEDYSNTLTRLASQYDTCSTQLNNYLLALNSGNEQTLANATATLQLSLRAAELAEATGLSADQIELVANQLASENPLLQENSELAADAAARYIKLNRAISDIYDNLDDYKQLLGAVNAEGLDALVFNDEYAKSFEQLKGYAADMFDTSSQFLGDDWIAAHLKDIIDVAENAGEGLQELQAIASQEILARTGIDMSGFNMQQQDFLNQIATLEDGADINTEANLDILAFIQNLVTAMEQAGYAQTEIENALSGMGIDVDLAPYEEGLNSAIEQAKQAGYLVSDNFAANAGVDVKTNTSTNTAQQQTIVPGQEFDTSYVTGDYTYPLVTYDTSSPFPSVSNVQTRSVQVSYPVFRPRQTKQTVDGQVTTAATGLEVIGAHKSSGGKVSHYNSPASRAGRGSGGSKGGGGGGGKSAGKPTVLKPTNSKTKLPKIEAKDYSTKKKDIKEVTPQSKYKEKQLDIYYEIDRQIEKQDRKLQQIDRKYDNSTPLQRLAIIEQQNQAIQEQIDLHKERQKISSDEITRLQQLAKQDQFVIDGKRYTNNLKDIQITVDEDGVANYNQIVDQINKKNKKADDDRIASTVDAYERYNEKISQLMASSELFTEGDNTALKKTFDDFIAAEAKFNEWKANYSSLTKEQQQGLQKEKQIQEEIYNNAKDHYDEQINRIKEVAKARGVDLDTLAGVFDKELETDLKNIEDFYDDTVTANEYFLDTIVDGINNAAEEAASDVKAIAELTEQQIEQKIEGSKIKVDLSLDTGQAEREFLDFKNKIIKKIKPDDFVGIAKGVYDEVASYLNSNQLINVDNQIKKIQGQLAIMQTGGTSEIYGNNTGQALEDLKHYYDIQRQALEDINDKIQDVQDTYLDSLDKVKDKMDQQLEYYERIGDAIQHNVRLTELLYGDKAYNTNDIYYNMQRQNDQQQLDQLKTARDYWQEQMNREVEGTDAWKTAYENAKDFADQFNDKMQSMIENLSKQFENKVDGIIEKMNNALTNGLGMDYLDEEWDAINNYDDKFLDTVERKMGTSEIERLYKDAAEGLTGNPKLQQRMNKLMQDQLKVLREKNKLTQYDLDRAKAALEVEKARMALEDSRNQKTTMRLRRDSQGNYTYQYVADEEKLEDLQGALEEAQANLYNMDKEHYKQNLEDMRNTYKDYLDKMRELTLAYNATQDEDERKRIQARMDLLKASSEELMNGLTEDNKQSLAYLTQSTFDALGIDPAAFSSAQQFEILKENVPQVSSHIQDLADNIVGQGGLLAATADAMKEINQATLDYDANVSKILATAGTSAEAIKDGTDQVLAQNIQMSQSLIDTNNDLVQSCKTQVEAIRELLKQMQKLADQTIDNQGLIDTIGNAYNTIQANNGSNIRATKEDLTLNKTDFNNQGYSEPAYQNYLNNMGAYAFANTTPIVNINGLFSGDNQQVLSSLLSSFGESIGMSSEDKTLLSELSNNIKTLNENNASLTQKLVQEAYDKMNETQNDNTLSADQQLALMSKEVELLNSQIQSAILNPDSFKTDEDALLKELRATYQNYLLTQLEAYRNGTIDSLDPEKMATMLDKIGDLKSQLDQTVHIEATFPNVSDRNEIVQAFNNLVNRASMQASKKV